MVARKPQFNYRHLILTTIGVAGIMSLTILAPNAVQALTLFGVGKRERYDKRYYLNKVVRRLERQGFLRMVRKNGILCARLTPKGISELRRYELAELQIKKPKKWDRRFRVVIFDIKEWKRVTRDELREWLLHLGFIRLQNSVWVYPYDCEEILALLKAHFKIGKEVLSITAEKIENDYWLRREFGLG